MQKILFALALMALFGNISRAADEHYLYPKGETCTTSDASYCYASARIVYQYATDSTGGVAITIAMEFSSPYFQPTGGIFVTERGVKEVIQDLTFHTVEAPAGKLSWLEPAEYFTGRYPVAQLKKSGDYSFTIAFGDGNSEAVMQFPEDHFPTFDLSEHICRLNRDQVAFDF